ncbi:putative glucose dehydrogenase [Melanogaster broomeanus]|nr:putative glucose dehydrogenase [Melanogaster broomeanus]
MGASFSQPTYVSDPSKLAYKVYDYIIVGGGTAGCVLASRLSQDPDVSVLLVEAGGSNVVKDSAGLFSAVGVGNVRLLVLQRAHAKCVDPSETGATVTEPQPALNGRQINYPRGKMLGGTASLNALVYHHCSPSDFDEWESKGAKGWNYQSLAPYLRKSEKFTPNSSFPVDMEYRGTTGVWHTTFGYMHDICNKWIEAAEAVGIPRIADLNTPRGNLGVTKFTTFIDQKGQRSSPATAFLSKDVLKRKNLAVVIGTLTTRIIFSPDGSPAGAINSPQLLMLSGIGDSVELRKLNIPVVKHLPHVGKNLLDHPMVSLILRAKDGYTLDYMQETMKANYRDVAMVLDRQRTSIVKHDKTLFNSKADEADSTGLIDNTSGPDAPDLEIALAPVSLRPLPRPNNGISLIPMLIRPVSTGRLSLVSSSPFDKPSIDPAFLADPADMPMLDLKLDSNDTKDVYWPGDADPDNISNTDLEEWIRNNCVTVNHCAGTARIGTSEEDSVVDADLKVWGISNLRVVDASVFPTMVSGHPTAPIVAIAERISDLIMKDTK